MTDDFVRPRAFTFGLVAILSPFLVACALVHPMADDFFYASNGRVGFWTAWSREYFGWNGRYASNALVLRAPLVFGWPGGHRVMAATMIVSTVVAVYAFVRACSAGGLTKREALQCSLAFSALFLSQAPSIGEGIYWYTSAVTYHAPLVLALLHFTLVIGYVSRDRPTLGDRMSLALAFLMLAALIGFNEVVMVLLLALYGALLAWSVAEGLPVRRLLAGIFAFSVLCALFVMFSPGNATRQSMFPAHHQLARSLGMSALQTLRFVGDWAASGSLLLATVIFVPIADRLCGPLSQNPRLIRHCLWMSAAGLLLVVPISVFPAYWETGILGQHRTVNVAYFAFLILWFVTVSLWMALMALMASGDARQGALRSFAEQWRVALAGLLVAALALTGNSYALDLDLVSGRLAGFDRELTGRDAALGACRDRGERICGVAPIRHRPASFFVLDISADPHDWVNVAYAGYFAVGEVRLDAAE